MKYLFILLSIVLFSCSSSTNVSNAETGGTSVEVTMVQGVVVNEQNKAVNGASIEILSHSGAALSQMITTSVDGEFSEGISFRGAMAIVVSDTLGNGAYKPCTLSTMDNSLNVDTIRLQQMGTLNFEFDYSKIEPASGDQRNFRIECWELDKMWQFDSLGNVIVGFPYSDSLQIPAGTYQFRLLTHVSNIQSDFMITDTIITVLPSNNNITVTPQRLGVNITEGLRKDLETLSALFKLNGFEDMTIQDLLNNAGVKDNRIILLSARGFDTIPDFIDQLDQLERIRMTDNKITTLPSTIENMKNLRYMDLCVTTDIKSYPNSITELPIELLDMEKLTYFACGFAESVRELPEIIYLMNEVSTIYTQLSWSPSEREKDWAFKRMFRGNQTEYENWLANQMITYGSK